MEALTSPRPVLFLTANSEDYLSDRPFHGLRTLLWERVVDFPKSEISYRTYPHLDRIYGRDFTLELQRGALAWAGANSTRWQATPFLPERGYADA